MAFSDWTDLANSVMSGVKTVAGYAKDVAPLVEAVGTGYSIYDAYNASKLADKAASTAGMTAQQQAELAARTAQYGEQGGQALQAALAKWMESAGTSGVFNPQQISELAAKYSAERAGELDGVMDRAGQYTNASNTAAASLYDQYLAGGRAISDPYRVSTGGNSAAAMGFDVPTRSAFQGAVPDALAFSSGIPDQLRYSQRIPGLNDFYFSPEEMGIDIPNVDTSFRAGTQDQLVSDLATGYLDRFSSETDRVLQDLYADQEVDSIRKGMDRSTYDLESKKASADVAARRRNQDVTAAVEAAMQTASGRIGMDTNVQAGNINNQASGLARAGTQLESFRTGQGYGSTVADDIYRQYGASVSRDDAIQADAYQRYGLSTARDAALNADAYKRLEVGMGLDQYGQDDAYRRLGAQMDIYKTGAGADELAMRAAGQNFDQYLKGINTASGQLSNAQGYYGNAQQYGLAYLNGIEAARPNASAQAWNQAYDDYAKLQGLRGTTQSQLTSAVTDPYKFMMGGATQAGSAFGSAGTTYGGLANMYSRQSTASGQAAGTGLARFADWKQT